MSSDDNEISPNRLALSQYLAECEPKSEINLNRFDLCDLDIESIVEEAIVHKECTKLSLCHSTNALTEKGVDLLFKALHQNKVRFHLFSHFILDFLVITYIGTCSDCWYKCRRPLKFQYGQCCFLSIEFPLKRNEIFSDFDNTSIRTSICT